MYFRRCLLLETFVGRPNGLDARVTTLCVRRMICSHLNGSQGLEGQVVVGFAQTYGSVRMVLLHLRD